MLIAVKFLIDAFVESFAGKSGFAREIPPFTAPVSGEILDPSALLELLDKDENFEPSLPEDPPYDGLKCAFSNRCL